MAASRLAAILLFLLPAVAAADDPLKPAERDFLFDYSRANFRAYQVAMRSHVSQQRVFKVPEYVDEELEQVLPFELAAATSTSPCGHGHSNQPQPQVRTSPPGGGDMHAPSIRRAAPEARAAPPPQFRRPAGLLGQAGCAG